VPAVLDTALSSTCTHCLTREKGSRTLAVHNLFSYRRRAADGNVPDVSVYDDLPSGLCVQIVHIWKEAIGPFNRPHDAFSNPVNNNDAWVFIHDLVAREHGRFSLAERGNAFERCVDYVLHRTSVDAALDLVEVSFRYVSRVIGRSSPGERRKWGVKVEPDSAIKELNERFRRAGVDYCFVDDMIMRVDSEYVHSEITLPALRRLRRRGFEGPREEFLAAHGHYRAGRNKEAVTYAHNAFESTLKAICGERGWGFPPGASASNLIQIVRNNGLLPEYLDQSFNQLVATLKSGLPKVRGEEGAHGQGATPRETPVYVAAYALYLAAATILFLVDAHLEP